MTFQDLEKVSSSCKLNKFTGTQVSGQFNIPKDISSSIDEVQDSFNSENRRDLMTSNDELIIKNMNNNSARMEGNPSTENYNSRGQSDLKTFNTDQPNKNKMIIQDGEIQNDQNGPECVISDE